MMRLFAPLLLLAVCTAAPAADMPQPSPLPGGFVDATGRIGIFNTPSGGVQAIELATGDMLWQSNLAQRPLFIADNRLYALAAERAPVVHIFGINWRVPGRSDGFRLVAFDMMNFGQVVQESETAELPDWVSIQDAHDRSFAAQWHTESGKLILTWEAKAWYAGRTRLAADAEAASRKNAAGSVAFDLETGAFESRPVQPATVVSPEFETRKDLERQVIRWQKTTAEQQLLLTQEEIAGKQILTLRSFDPVTSQPRSVRELTSGRRLTVLTTIDEQYLCVRDAVSGPDLDDRDKRPEVQWSIFATDGGHCIAEVPYAAGTTAAAIDGGRAYFLIAGRIDGSLERSFVVARSLRAVDLRTGMTVWERPVGGKPASVATKH